MSDKDRNSTRPGPPPKPTKGGISTGLKVGGLTKAQSSDDALRAENERLRVQVEETAKECGLQKTDNERLRAALTEYRERHPCSHAIKCWSEDRAETLVSDKRA